MTRAHRRMKAVTAVLTFGMVFAPLGCVARVADVVASGLTFGGTTGLLGPAGPFLTPFTAGFGLLTDLFRLIN